MEGQPFQNLLTPAALKYYLRWQESATCRYLASIRDLARLRKLQTNMPTSQMNTQINLLAGER